LPDRVADYTPAQLLEIPGIGRDLSGRIREIIETGGCAYHQELLAEFPPTLLQLLRLQGVGPKTAALLYRVLRVRNLEDLEEAARAGRIRTIKGMGARKEQLILQALEERQRHGGRHLLAETAETADTLREVLRHRAPGTAFVAVGSLRRGVETCGDLDMLAVGGEASLMDHFTGHPLVERVLARGQTKSSVLLRSGIQADLRLVPAESAGAALQYFTGSKPHNIALRDRAIQRGLKLNEYGLYRADTDERVAGADEEGIYQALGLAWVPPELRENRGEVEAAERGSLPRLVELGDIRGDLHCHSDASDGRDDVEALARAARAAGLSYLAITDHSKSVPIAGGLDEAAALEHARRVREAGSRVPGIRLLTGIECDIRPDGTLDLAEDCLAALDVVVASVHSALGQDEAQMTERLLRAIESPVVHIIGHPTGRLLLRREPCRVAMDRVIEAAARHRVALEINCQVDRLDLNDILARQAARSGVRLVVSSDAHATGGFATLRWGVVTARRAWLRPEDVLNTRPADDVLAALRR
jgi:DNA polymerase (family 10)